MAISIELILNIFLVAFLLNFLWEVWHSELYLNTIRMPYVPRIKKLTVMSFKDAFFVVVFYVISVTVFNNVFILNNLYQILFFLIISLLFSFIDEKIAIRLGRWEYSNKMPVLLGVGITPLLEVAVTGFVSFLVVFYL